LRKVLVVFQFFISIGLIIGALVIYRQNRFLLNKDLGYTSDQVVVVPMRGPREKFAAFRQELLRNPNILNVADSDYLPYDSSNWTNVSWEGAGPEDYIKINVNYVDENFIPTFAMTVLKGTAFTEGMRSWKENAAILNEAAARKIGWDDPVGKRLLYNVDYRSRTVGGATVVGVVKDFHFLSLHHPIGPIMLRLGSTDWLGGNLYAKISTRDVPGTIASMKKEFEKAYPGFNFAYRFLDEDFRQVYLEERKAGRIVSGLSLIAVFIACLGLVGLSSLAIGQKTKEIGIRRVMGAPISEIALRFTREFLFLVALANVLAWPVAYFAVREWLNNFPYRIDLGWPVFLLAGGAALVLAFVTVGFLAFRAAAADPVESLRYE
jgi:putative ABC transport system permease protein